MRRRVVLGVIGAAVSWLSLNRAAGATEMKGVDENKLVVRELIERVWRQGRLDELSRFWTADCVNHADPAADRQGLAAVRRYHEGFAGWFKDFNDIRISIEQQIAEGDRVVSQVVLRAFHIEKQRQIEMATIRIDRLAAGKIAEHWSVADQAGLMRQLG